MEKDDAAHQQVTFVVNLTETEELRNVKRMCHICAKPRIIPENIPNFNINHKAGLQK